MPVPILQLRLGEALPSRALRRLPERDTQGLRRRPTIRSREILGVFEVLAKEARHYAPSRRDSQEVPPSRGL